MNIKTVYLAIIIIFYISIPVAVNAEKIALLARGNNADLVFKRYDTMNDREMIDNYYYAYKDAFPVIRRIALVVLVIWAVAFVLSVFVLLRSDISIPYRADLITAAISLGVIVVNLWPYFIYGKSWPPRMF